MFEYIENLKTKPEHVRKRFAFITSFSISAVIFLGWVASYGINSSPVLTDNKDGKSKVEAPVSSLTASAINIYGDVKSIIFGSNKVDYSSQIEVTGGGR